MTAPLWVLEDENGDLFLSTEATCGESTSPVRLDDVHLWDAYFDACRKANMAKHAVIAALHIPTSTKKGPR